MRLDAAQTLHQYDMRPADGDTYNCLVVDKGGRMIKALREWEARRGIVHSYRTRYVPPVPKPKPETKPETKNDKPKPKAHRKIVVPRLPGKPGPKPKYTPEERRKLKNERNKQYKRQNNDALRAKHKRWRDKRTPEQIEKARQAVRDHRARKRAANSQGSVCAARMPLPDVPVS